MNINNLRLAFLNWLDYKFNRSSYKLHNLTDIEKNSSYAINDAKLELYAINGAKLEFSEKIIGIEKIKPQYLYEITLENGRSISVTKDTKFLSYYYENVEKITIEQLLKEKRSILVKTDFVGGQFPKSYFSGIKSIVRSRFKYTTYKIYTTYDEPTYIVNCINVVGGSCKGKILLKNNENLQFTRNLMNFYYMNCDKATLIEELNYMLDLK